MATSSWTERSRSGAGLSVVTFAAMVVSSALGFAACTDSRPATSSGGEPTASPPSVSPPNGNAGDAGGKTNDSGPGPAVDPALVCASVSYGASGVEEVAEPGPVPEPSGGDIVPGRYVLTQVLGYRPGGDGPTGYFARKAVLFGEGGTFAMLESEGDTTNGVGPSTVTGGTYEIQQTNLVAKQVCPEDTGVVTTYPFSASGARFALRSGDRWEIYQRK